MGLCSCLMVKAVRLHLARCVALRCARSWNWVLEGCVAAQWVCGKRSLAYAFGGCLRPDTAICCDVCTVIAFGFSNNMIVARCESVNVLLLLNPMLCKVLPILRTDSRVFWSFRAVGAL